MTIWVIGHRSIDEISSVETFLVMWMVGFTLNVLTLLALTLIIGILVDNSIVIIENIERHLRMGKTPKRAAVDGPSEIGLAALAITLTDVIVYVPVAFTSGIIGQFFFNLAVTPTGVTKGNEVVARAIPQGNGLDDILRYGHDDFI